MNDRPPSDHQITGRRARRRRNRLRRAHRAARCNFAEFEAGVWREQAELWRLHAEALLMDRQVLLSSPVSRLLAPTQEQERLAMTRLAAVPFTPEAEGASFLGLNLYAWMMAPDELLGVLGLLDQVASWRRQAAEAGLWPVVAAPNPPTSGTIH